MSALDDLFARCRSEGRAALVGYLPAGFPSYDASVEAMVAMVEAGVDVVEIGMPYSDPLMEGPVIQAAHQASLDAGTRQADVLRAVSGHVPAVVMGYWNPVEKYGPARFAADLKAAGGAGAITPDLIPEEAAPWLAAAAEQDLAPVFLVAPSSTDERIAVVGRTNRGFVYAAAVMGVTGARTEVGAGARDLVRRTRAQTALPVAVGLGVSTGAQAAQVASFADGVVVGSALVRALDTGGVDAVRRLAAELAQGVRNAVPA
ncbi:MAG: trpA [Frankiales bacterium]|nr:trpA [Frankiales bacterium]